jgi:hypothetical protein
MAMSAKAWKVMTPAKVYFCETLRERLAQHLQDVAAELGQFVQEEHAVARQDTSPGIATRPPPISPTSEMV